MTIHAFALPVRIENTAGYSGIRSYLTVTTPGGTLSSNKPFVVIP
jgi:hypothetical protein